MAKLKLYRTDTELKKPEAANLEDGQLSLNMKDERLYFKNSDGQVVEPRARISEDARNSGTDGTDGGLYVPMAVDQSSEWPDLRPSFGLNFQMAQQLSKKITFSRAGKSWAIVDQQLKEFDVDQPVFTDQGLSLQPAETNLVWPSVPASGTWGTTNVTWGDTVEAAGYTLRRVNVGAAGVGVGKGIGRTNMSAAAGETVLLATVVLPNAGNGFCALSFSGYTTWEGDTGAQANFDLHAGTSSWLGGAGVAKGMQQLEDGAWLCWTVGKKKSDTSDTSLSPAIAVWPTGTASSGTEHLHVGGVQVVKGVGDLVPPIPTTSAAVTRPADVAVIQGQAFASVFNPSEGAIILDSTLTRIDGYPRYFDLGDSVSGRLSLFLAPIGEIYLNKFGTVVPALGGNNNGRPVKTGLTWENGVLDVWIDGVKRINATPVGGDLSALDIFHLTDRASGYRGAKISRRLTIFKQRPSDAEMQAMTRS